MWLRHCRVFALTLVLAGCTDRPGGCELCTDPPAAPKGVGAICQVDMECLSRSCIAAVCTCPVDCPSDTCADPACACNVDTGAPCTSGTVCMGGPCGTTCGEPGARGAYCLHLSDNDLCDTSGPCAVGLVCALHDFGDGADGLCVPPDERSIDEVCAQTEECLTGLFCDTASQRCVAPSVSVGGGCNVTNECRSGACIAGICVCPVDCPSETCTDPACACNVDTDAPCAAGSVCSGGVCGTSCTEPGARGASCLHRSDDDPCPTSGTCADGLVCAVRDFDKYADGFCLPPAGRALNEVCAQTAECAAELVCDTGTQRCVAP